MALISVSDVNYSVQDPNKNIYLKLELVSLQSSVTTATDDFSILIHKTADFQKEKLGGGLDFKTKLKIVEIKADVYKYYVDPGNSALKYYIIESNNDNPTQDQPGTLVKEIDPAIADLQNNIVSYSFDIYFS